MSAQAAWRRLGYIVQRAVFTVPSDTPHERVLWAKERYQKRFGDWLERQGYRVLRMSEPEPERRAALQPEPDRKGYVLYAAVTRRPHEVTLDIPDNAVPVMQAIGLKLKE